MKKFLFISTFNIGLFVVFCICFECAGQFAYFIKNGHFVFQHQNIHKQIFERHPYLVARLRKEISATKDGKTISSTNKHTRKVTDEKLNPDRTKIAILGGSTAFGTGVSDEESWPAILQKKLGSDFEVINYAIPGFSTAEAIIQMALILPEEQPDIVVFYEGWNDIRNYHDKGLGPDYYSHGMKQYNNLQVDDYINSNNPLMCFLSKNLATVLFVVKLKKKLLSQKPMTTYKTKDPFVDHIYERNLKKLQLLSRDINAKMIFVPQVLNEYEYENKDGSKPWSPTIQNKAMPELMSEFNQIMINICDAKDCLVADKVISQEWKQSDFVDEGHFSYTGGQIFASLVQEKINQYDSM